MTARSWPVGARPDTSHKIRFPFTSTQTLSNAIPSSAPWPARLPRALLLPRLPDTFPRCPPGPPLANDTRLPVTPFGNDVGLPEIPFGNDNRRSCSPIAAETPHPTSFYDHRRPLAFYLLSYCTILATSSYSAFSGGGAALASSHMHDLFNSLQHTMML